MKKNSSKPHFAKEHNYAPQEIWRTDFTIGQKGSVEHGHLALSGSSIWYLRDELGKEIIVDGKVYNVIKQNNEPQINLNNLYGQTLKEEKQSTNKEDKTKKLKEKEQPKVTGERDNY